ncbi:uncharacterized protein LOC130979242 [Arachis stenosperma]|uniref:uncharacterized protein LOC130979242 n=1 Tax=Arachis stenosperma TaxID=217475 RepID=UPI0025ABAA04|nr:uncharacterized protein LOC130979242 [Arachis stenosperma]
MVACSNSRPIGTSSSLPVIQPKVALVASSSFAVDLNRTRDGEVGNTGPFGDVAIGGAPDGVEDAFYDEDDDDMDPTTIADDSNDELARSTSVGSDGAASSETPQYPLCTWLIRISLRQCRGIWVVKRYNGPHTCLATSLSIDHKRLDYHVISAFILPMIRVDVAISIKVLQNATETHFGFRPTYKSIWMAKQKTVAQIYGDWKESYNELPQWLLGVQMMMPGSVAVLRTTLVRLGG